MRITAFVRVLLILVALLIHPSSGALADAHALSGKMAWWQQVVGFWSCEVNLDPSPGNYPQKGFTIGEGSVAPDNVFHWSERASGFEAEQFDGYATNEKDWWETQSDSTGYASVFRSSNGLIFEGSPSPGSALEEDGSRFRETYSIGSDGTFDEVVKRRLRGSWRPFSEASCKRITAPRHNILSYSGGSRSMLILQSVSGRSRWQTNRLIQSTIPQRIRYLGTKSGEHGAQMVPK